MTLLATRDSTPSDDDNGQWNYMCGFQFCSNSILAHHDYGEMAYTDGMRGCNYHGI